MNSSSSAVQNRFEMVQGFYGKLPSLGDFVTRELPRDFLDPWDEWLQQSIATSKSELGDSWLSTYLHSPIWRFVVVPEVCGTTGWAGILMPSVDKVGRYFPLTVATSVGDNAEPFRIIDSAASWFDAAEELALSVLDEERVDADTLASSIAALDNSAMSGDSLKTPILQGGEWGLRLTGTTDGAMSPVVCHELVSFQVGVYSIWWTPGLEGEASMGLIAPKLPAPQSFARLLAGTWNEQPQTAETIDALISGELNEEPM